MSQYEGGARAMTVPGEPVQVVVPIPLHLLLPGLHPGLSIVNPCGVGGAVLQEEVGTSHDFLYIRAV
ncbi:hypothetical protein ACO2Q8_20220 [Larkinella sp. VNQ87]